MEPDARESWSAKRSRPAGARLIGAAHLAPGQVVWIRRAGWWHPATVAKVKASGRLRGGDRSKWTAELSYYIRDGRVRTVKVAAAHVVPDAPAVERGSEDLGLEAILGKSTEVVAVGEGWLHRMRLCK